MKVLKFIDIEVDGIHDWDGPDYSDAHVTEATAVLADGTMRDATDEEIEEMNQDSELIYQCITERLY
jgi:hypothetical protein